MAVAALTAVTEATPVWSATEVPVALGSITAQADMVDGAGYSSVLVELVEPAERPVA
jgi:hypothetical protein